MTQQEIAEVFTEQPIAIATVRLPRWGRLGKLLRLYRKVDLEIKSIPVGKVQLIGAALKNMAGASALEGLSQSDQINKLLADNVAPLVTIVALACTRGKQMPSPDLINAIASQMSMRQLEFAINQVYRRLDLEPFFGILSLAKSLNLSLFPDQEAPGQP